MGRIKLLTHNDLDGVGCAVLAKIFLGEENVDIEYCNYDNIDDRALNSVDYDKIIITDISVAKETASILDKHKGIILLDHHKTAEHLNDYHWCVVKTEVREGLKTSGTRLLYDYLTNPGVDLLKTKDVNKETKVFVSCFVECVRAYDTWDWVKQKTQFSKDLNDLLYLLGLERFEKKCTKALLEHSEVITSFDRTLLEIEQEKMDEYIGNKQSELKTFQLGEYKVGGVFGEKYASQLGNKLAKNNDVDFIAVINLPNSISLRGIKEDIDLGRIAKNYDGGGHPLAAGLPVNSTSIKDFVNPMLEEI